MKYSLLIDRANGALVIGYRFIVWIGNAKNKFMGF